MPQFYTPFSQTLLNTISRFKATNIVKKKHTFVHALTSRLYELVLFNKSIERKFEGDVARFRTGKDCCWHIRKNVVTGVLHIYWVYNYCWPSTIMVVVYCLSSQLYRNVCCNIINSTLHNTSTKTLFATA